MDPVKLIMILSLAIIGLLLLFEKVNSKKFKFQKRKK